MPGLTDGQIKGLFFQLVKAAGGVEAAAAAVSECGHRVSHQRISQLQSLNHGDMPTLRQVRDLEAFVGQPIVSAALAASVALVDGGKSPLEEACEVSETAARVLQLVRSGATDREIDAEIVRLRKEIDDVPVALAANDHRRGRARP